MSRIITYLKCDKCGKERNIYISFGHPDEDFTWNWKCECGHVNEKLIEAMPDIDFLSKETKENLWKLAFSGFTEQQIKNLLEQNAKDYNND